MINEEMLKNLYSHLDTHKKGFLLENDFIGHFGSFNIKSELTREFIESLQNKFKTCDEAYKCISSYKPKQPVNFTRFEQFCKETFG